MVYPFFSRVLLSLMHDLQTFRLAIWAQPLHSARHSQCFGFKGALLIMSAALILMTFMLIETYFFACRSHNRLRASQQILRTGYFWRTMTLTLLVNSLFAAQVPVICPMAVDTDQQNDLCRDYDWLENRIRCWEIRRPSQPSVGTSPPCFSICFVERQQYAVRTL